MGSFSLFNINVSNSVDAVNNGKVETVETAEDGTDNCPAEGAEANDPISSWKRKAKELVVVTMIALTASTGVQSEQATETLRDFFGGISGVIAPITEPAGDDIGRKFDGKHGALVQSLLDKEMYGAAIEFAKDEEAYSERVVAIVSRNGSARDAFTALRDLVPALDGSAGTKASQNLLSRIAATGDAGESLRAISWMYAKPERYERLQADQGLELAKAIAANGDETSIRQAQELIGSRFEQAFFIDPAGFNELRETLQAAYFDAKPSIASAERHVRDNQMFSPSQAMDFFLAQNEPMAAVRYVMHQQEAMGLSTSSDVNLSQHGWLTQQHVDQMAALAISSGDAYQVATVAAVMPLSNDVLHQSVEFVSQHGDAETVLHLAKHAPIYHLPSLQEAVAQRGDTNDLMRFVAEVEHADLSLLRGQVSGRSDAEYSLKVIDQVESRNAQIESDGFDLDSPASPAVESRSTVVM